MIIVQGLVQATREPCQQACQRWRSPSSCVWHALPHETRLWDYSTNVVLIEPLASLQAVEDFLWPRVFRSNPPPEARSIASPPTAAFAAAQAAAAARKSTRSSRSKSGRGDEQVQN